MPQRAKMNDVYTNALLATFMENKQKKKWQEYIFNIRIIAMCNTNTFEKSKVFVEIARCK